MLEGVDLRLVGIISLIIVIILGYIVYVMYQDVSVIKKDVDEINYKNSNQEQNQEDYSDEEYSNEDDHDHNQEIFENFNIDGQDLSEFEQTINSYIEEEAEYPEESTLEPIEEEQEEPEIKVKEKKPRKYNKKTKVVPEEEQEPLEE